MSATRTDAGRRGDLFGARFELFADVLAVGLAVSVAALPLLTAPAALATACTLLRRRLLCGEPCTAGRFFALLRRRLARRGEWEAGAVACGFAALLGFDAGLAAAGLPGAAAVSAALAALAAAAAVAGLRTCALGPYEAHEPNRAAEPGELREPGEAHEPSPRWTAAVRTAAARAVRDRGGSVLVVLALCTAAVCTWALPPVVLLLPGPLALALTAVELRWEGGR